MPRNVDLDAFAGQAQDLVEGVAAGGESVVVTRAGAPVAVLASPTSGPWTGAAVDLPRWEEWLHEMQAGFSGAAGGSAAQARPAEPPAVDKSMLGFDPGAGHVGSASGRDFLGAELSRINVPVTDSDLLATIYAASLELCENKQTLYVEDLRALAQELIAEAPQRLRLLTVTVTSTTGLPATAEVTLELGRGPAMRREQGDGPLDAALKAIQKLTGLDPEVENFSVVAATPGRDAMAEAVIELLLDGRRAVGAGASTNAIEAGIHAYLNALNFLIESRPPAPP